MVDEIVEVVASDGLEVAKLHVGLDEFLQVHHNDGLQSALGTARDVERAAIQEVLVFARVNRISLLLPLEVRLNLVVGLLIVPAAAL